MYIINAVTNKTTETETMIADYDQPGRVRDFKS